MSLKSECLGVVGDELSRLEGGKFTGNVEFRVNLHEGVLRNVNVGLNKSIKLGGKTCLEAVGKNED